MNRIFISYRASDGKKDADRLCADLSRLYGDDQVFFDKQDLVGGLSWRSAIEAALGSQPAVLLLMTPDLFGAQHPEGGRRIDREDDPVRGELLTAQAHGALIVPLLTEGMAMPPAAELPESLRFLKEAHALKLRTEDWHADLGRLVADLQAHGIALATETHGQRATERARAPRGLAWAAGGFLAALVVLGGLLLWREAPAPAPEPVSPAQARAASVAGIWWAIDPAGRRLRVQFTVKGDEEVAFQTDPFPVEAYPSWQAYAHSVRDMGLVVKAVRFAGTGTLTDRMGVPRLDIPYQAYSAEGRGPLDTGGLVLEASAGGRELAGEIWSNGDQAATPWRLVR